MEPLVAVAAAFVGFFAVSLAVYVTIEYVGQSDGPVLPSHYNPARYASGEYTSPPETVGICEDCGVWTDPDAGFCPICTGSVRRIVADDR